MVGGLMPCLINSWPMKGYEILAKSCATQKITHSYGIVGIPVIQLGFALQDAGLSYFGFRNEQQAAYSAGITGYLTANPALCLVVSGPGHTNAISGLANARVNGWPMILISGASDLNQQGRGAFQQSPQLQSARPFVKMAVRISSAQRIPFAVKQAVRISLSGRPGPVYLQLPGDVLGQQVSQQIQFPPRATIPKCIPDQKDLLKAVQLIKSAKAPLIIVGKGAAYAQAQKQVRELVAGANIPFLASPMGKGVVQDDSRLNIGAARSKALGQSDLVILLGARLNWIMHFGLPPRFKKEVKVIQVDVEAQEFSRNISDSVNLWGNIELTVPKLSKLLNGWSFKDNGWLASLQDKCKKNVQVSKNLMEQEFPLTYYSAFQAINRFLKPDDILVAEGANTMDIGRTVFQHSHPRSKLDAASFGTMGIGLPSIISAKSVFPERRVVATMGDSAFGFSGMQCQTLTRYKLGAIIFIINNNGIYSGLDQLPQKPSDNPVTALNPSSKYQLLAEAFGGVGFQVRTKTQLLSLCKRLQQTAQKRLVIVNVHIESSSSKKAQEHGWLTRESPKSKL